MTLKLLDGRRVTIEQTITAITAHYDGEPEPRAISSEQYMRLVMAGVPVGTTN